MTARQARDLLAELIEKEGNKPRWLSMQFADLSGPTAWNDKTMIEISGMSPKRLLMLLERLPDDLILVTDIFKTGLVSGPARPSGEL